METVLATMSGFAICCLPSACPLLARLQTWRALIFIRVCLSVYLSVCLSLTGTSTLQHEPILTKLGSQEPYSDLHCESKKLGHFYFYCSFVKCWPIL